MLNRDIEDFEIEPGEVEAILDREGGERTLVDVREDWELVRGVLPNAVHAPLSRFREFDRLWEPDKQYVVYCEHGIRSLDVVMWLVEHMRVDAKSMRGGFVEWHGPVANETADGGA